MRQMKYMLFIALLILFTWQNVYPCDIRLESRDKVIKKGKETVVTVTVFLEHRRCHLGIEETEFMTDGIVIKSQSAWKQAGNNLYKAELHIVLTKDEGEIRVGRDCRKKGLSEGVLRIRSAS